MVMVCAGALPAAVETTIAPEVVLSGTLTVRVAPSLEVERTVADWPPMVTVASVRFAPVMVMVSPGLAVVGETFVTVGAGREVSGT